MTEELPSIFYTMIKFHNGNKKLAEYIEKIFTKSKEETFLISAELAKNIFNVEINDDDSWNETFGPGVWNISSSYMVDEDGDLFLQITTENSVPHQLLLKLAENIRDISKKAFLTGTYICDKGASGAFRYSKDEHKIEEVNHIPGDTEIDLDLETLRESLEVENL